MGNERRMGYEHCGREMITADKKLAGRAEEEMSSSGYSKPLNRRKDTDRASLVGLTVAMARFDEWSKRRGMTIALLGRVL